MVLKRGRNVVAARPLARNRRKVLELIVSGVQNGRRCGAERLEPAFAFNLIIASISEATRGVAARLTVRRHAGLLTGASKAVGMSLKAQVCGRRRPEHFSRAPYKRPRSARRTSAASRISDQLASLIASGILQVGEELPSRLNLPRSWRSAARLCEAADPDAGCERGRRGEPGLAHALVVSRKIDALRIGVTSPNVINAYELNSVHKARVLIERSVAAEAAAHIDESALVRLEQSLSIQKPTTRDPVHFVICDREFHLHDLSQLRQSAARRLRYRPLYVHA